MRITKSELKTIIKEELTAVMKEHEDIPGIPPEAEAAGAEMDKKSRFKRFMSRVMDVLPRSKHHKLIQALERGDARETEEIMSGLEGTISDEEQKERLLKYLDDIQKSHKAQSDRIMAYS